MFDPARVRGGAAFRDGLEAERQSLGGPSWRTQMTKVQKITLPPSRHSLQQAGTEPVQRAPREGRRFDRAARRKHRAAHPAEEPECSGRRRPEGNETGMFEVPAGGRRYRALELLVKQKRMAKTQPVPCVVREGGIAEDDSLAENDEPARPVPSFPDFE